MKLLLTWGGCGLCAVCISQTNGLGTTERQIRMLQERDLLPRDEAKPSDQSKGQSDKLPAPDPYRKDLKLIHADTAKMTGRDVSMDGAVEFDYKGYKIFADHVTGNLDTTEFALEGNIKVVGADALISGQKASVNLDRRTFVAEKSKSTLRPSLIKGGIQDDLFVSGGKFSGDERQEIGTDTDITTCNLEHPHYHIHAGSTDIKRGDRAILRKVDFYLFGHKRFSIPYLWIPLRDQTYDYLPQVGQSPDEGYYIKNRWGVPLRGDKNHLDARFDYMSKLGVGIGGDYAYLNKSTGGLLKIYTILGAANTLTISDSHRQEFRFGSLSVDTNYEKNNYLSAPGSTLLSVRSLLSLRPDKNGNTSRFTFSHSGNSSSGYDSSNDTFGISDQRKWSNRIRTTVDVNYSSSSSSSTGGTPSNRQQIDIRVRGDEDLKQATASLEIQRTVPVGHIDNFFSGADRYPVLTVQSDSRRLFGDKAKVLPFKAELSFGEFGDPVSQSQIGRYNFDLSFQRPNGGKGKLKWDTNGEFKQGFYSDDTAQYSLNLGTALSYSLGKDTSANLRYNYLRPFGYTPLQIDRTGNVHAASLDISYRPFNRTLVGLQTGYDFTRLDTKDIPWQQVGIRTEYAIKDSLLFRTLSSYDTIQESWSTVQLDLSTKARGVTFALGSRFDALRHTWSNASLSLNNYRTGKTTFSTNLIYNGFTQQFDQQQYNFVYDLHCWEAVLSVVDNSSGFRSGREINFFFRLKAFPFQSPFGTTRRGEPTSYGNGTSF